MRKPGQSPGFIASNDDSYHPTAEFRFNGLGFYARNFVQADDYLVILAASAVSVHGNKVLSGRQSAIVHEFNPPLIGMQYIGLHDRHWMATTSLLLL